jgi:oxygen-independent coproporphyrinogen-3 oxidase
MRFGIYIHFPWCRKRCPYCDFAIAVAKEEPPHEDYLQAVLAELAEKASLFAGKQLVSIYFGGGTPSVWRASCVATLVESLCSRFDADPAQLEISMECNPTDCQSESFAAWRDAGVTRLLVGVQATNQKDLLTLGRDHSMGDGLSALQRCLGAEFASVGADVILGVPGSASALASLRDVAALRPPHISAYELTIEERAPLAKQVARGEIVPEDEDVLADLYLAAHELLGAQGYEHYEVSSYAEIGHRAVHNSLYWQGADYLGLGNGAASLLRLPTGGARRWQNHRGVGRYLRGAASQHVDVTEEIDPEEFATELLWLAMRTADGAEESCRLGREAVFAAFQEEDLVTWQDGRIRPTIRGFLYNNQLIRRLGVG